MEEQYLVSVLRTADGREIVLNDFFASRPAFVIGTDSRADLQLMGEGIAPSHAIITTSGAHYRIAPRLPHTSVTVNGSQVKMPVALTDGALIQIGSVRLSYALAEWKTLPPPAQPVHVILPAVLPKGFPTQDSNTPSSVSTPRRLAGQGEVYFPRRDDSSGNGFSGMLAGLAVLLVIGGVIGYSLFGTVTSTAAGDLTAQFAYKDGNVTVVMFDADW
ncbi:MAG: FHA domain-containing protein [Anaerolineae bacterium]